MPIGAPTNGDGLEQHAAEREHVRACVEVALAARLLGCHVAGRADGHARARHRGCPVVRRRHARRARDAEVEHAQPVDLAVLEEQVARLDVAVDHALGVCDGEALGRVARDGDRLGDIELADAQLLRQVDAVEPRHRHVRHALGDAVIDVANDAVVLEPAQHQRLACEPRVPGIAAQQLDRDACAGLAITRSPHGAHTTATRQRLELEAITDEAAGAIEGLRDERVHDGPATSKTDTRPQQGVTPRQSGRPNEVRVAGNSDCASLCTMRVAGVVTFVAVGGGDPARP
jgi:hypothetical protein